MMFHARIRLWIVVERAAPDVPPTRHVQGWIVGHDRLSPGGLLDGEPYIGSHLEDLDLEGRMARNHRGRLIQLVGDPWPGDKVPEELRRMQERAEAEWRLPPGTTWRRIA
ncbi:hypothetical protein [Falsiroseomonas sp. E2-1-a20]|uniref:hypothetical protein n=1 Tax=Falsiroseomonas sp. E2-1-a20 TaxID=3239300 RepID=UPI003F3672B7